MPGELEGKVAIVTGGSRGIGLACAEALVGAGAKVAITGRNADVGAAAAEGLGGGTVFFEQDVGSDADWDRVMAGVKDAFGRLDIMVANAGISNFAPMEAMSLEVFRELNDINLKGCFLSLKYGTAALREHGDGGSIVLMSSIMGRISAAANTHYSGAKAGVILMAKAAALELGSEQIRVNAILPGLTHSDMTAWADEEMFAPAIPMKRFGEAKEVAQAVLFAASDRSKFMTGAEITLDGGHRAQ